MILEENKLRCDFFKYYKFDEADKIGNVSEHSLVNKLSYTMNAI